MIILFMEMGGGEDIVDYTKYKDNWDLLKI
jgi:hypothetical protein